MGGIENLDYETISVTDIKNALDIDELIQNNTEEANKIANAIQEDIYVVPTTHSYYYVLHQKPEKISVYLVKFSTDDNEESCDCDDFRYRCINGEHNRCKHLWRVVLTSFTPLMPLPKQNTLQWVHSQVEDDIFDIIELLENTNNETLETIGEQYNSLQDKIKTNNISPDKAYVDWRTLHERFNKEMND